MQKTTPFFIVSILLFLFVSPLKSELIFSIDGYASAGDWCADRPRENFGWHPKWEEFTTKLEVDYPLVTCQVLNVNGNPLNTYKAGYLCKDENGNKKTYDPSKEYCKEDSPPPIDCNNDKQEHFQDFFFEGAKLGEEPNSLDHCSGPGGKGGCNMKEQGVAVCIGDSSGGSGVTCSATFTASGRCSEGTSTEADPTTKPPEGVEAGIVTPELDGDQINTSEFNFDSSKMGNCGTFNGETKCFPLAESSKEGDNKGKDLLVKPSGDTEGTEGLDKIGKVKGSDGQEFDIYDASIDDNAPVTGGFDSGGAGSGTSSGSGDGSGTGSGDGSGDGSGTGSGDGSGDAPTSEAEEWGENPEGVDTEAFQGEIDGYVSDLNKASDDLAQENEEKAQKVAEDMQGALLDYLMPDISYSGGCDLGTVNVNLFGSSGSAPLSLCPYLTIFETMGNIFFLFANISAVFIFIRTFTGTGA